MVKREREVRSEAGKRSFSASVPGLALSLCKLVGLVNYVVVGKWDPGFGLVVEGSGSDSTQCSSLFELVRSPFESETAWKLVMAKGTYKAQMKAFGEHTPFAVRGLLGKDGFSQVRGYKTITQSPIGLGNSSLPTRPTSRPLHAGRAIMGPVANRPLSPHLPIKKPQFSASFSISHRIFGVALGVAIMLPPILYKLSLQFDV
ncbi:Succinate dehydrogenase subunit 3 [Rhynchospora pubera]|uniref:Succinate dehydrogenase subunit 3 n=1 Tax=Rhynchospora pubera TaxID=906938 RepID=A0AAV8GEB6_9POAL|nr:Succinate dehydrogenase subunit 3 [Rhynchospora pubera]